MKILVLFIAIQYKTTDAVKIVNNPCSAKLVNQYCNSLKVWNPKLNQGKNKPYLEFYIKWFYHGNCELNYDDYQNCAMKLNQVGDGVFNLNVNVQEPIGPYYLKNLKYEQGKLRLYFLICDAYDVVKHFRKKNQKCHFTKHKKFVSGYSFWW